MKHLHQAHGVDDLDFVIVFDSSYPLPQCDDRTVVLIYADEKCRLPVEVGAARLILTCMGIQPSFPGKLAPDFPSLLDYARFTKERLESWWTRRRIGADAHQAIVKKTMPIPLGYARPRDLPIKPMLERRYAAAFSGSLRNLPGGRLLAQPLSGLPKAAARAHMIAEIERIRGRFTGREFRVELTDSFDHSLQQSGDEYSSILMDSMICLAPRGTRMESWRVFEGLRYGCVVISQPLPDRWFYRGSPVIQLSSWRQLGAVVEDLLTDPALLQALHQRSLAWWREVCSAEAVARRIGGVLAQPR